MHLVTDENRQDHPAPGPRRPGRRHAVIDLTERQRARDLARVIDLTGAMAGRAAEPEAIYPGVYRLAAEHDDDGGDDAA